jgi:hypothetical protein
VLQGFSPTPEILRIAEAQVLALRFASGDEGYLCS